MKKRWLYYFLITIVLLAVVAGLVLWRYQVNQRNQLNTNNQWPIEAFGNYDFYTLQCDYEDMYLHSYSQAPELAGGWLSLVDISCLYLNSSKKLERIYLPFWVYQPETQESLKMGASIKQENQEEVLRLMNATNKEWFEIMASKLLHGKTEKGNRIIILLNFPTEDFSLNETQGAAFETLEQDDPPYTQEGLAAFRQTGDSHYLPQIKGKSYFWPIADYNF